MVEILPFEEDGPTADPGSRLVLDLDGFEGPIDLLLELARQQKVDLTRISILELAEQYLAYIAQARDLRLEIAADYLVMAAWLAYLKSRLLLPKSEAEEEKPTGEEMAAALAFQLRRLEAMRQGAERLMARPRLGHDVFARGEPEGVRVDRKPVYQVTLYDLLSAYARQRRRKEGDAPYRIAPVTLFTIDQAMERLSSMLGRFADWTTIWSFLPPGLADGLPRRSALASTLVASLEMVRTGRAELHQESAFGPIYLRPAKPRG